jgi:hypothetical protein
VGDRYTQTIVDNGLSVPGGISVDGSGNIYVIEIAFNRVWKLSATLGAFTCASNLPWKHTPTNVAIHLSFRMSRHTFSKTHHRPCPTALHIEPRHPRIEGPTIQAARKGFDNTKHASQRVRCVLTSPKSPFLVNFRFVDFRASDCA